MHPDKRRAGRRIRKTRRIMRETSQAFTAMGVAASIAAERLTYLFSQFAPKSEETE